MQAITRISVLIIVFMGIVLVVHAERFVLPAEDETLVQINQPAMQSLDPENISVLVWNMRKGSMHGWRDDYQILFADKDLLLLQEVMLDENMMGAFRADIQHSYQTAISFYDAWHQHAGTGVATASAVMPANIRYLRSHHREPFADTPKMGLFVEYQLSGTNRALLVANIHALNFVSVDKHENMLREIERILAAHHGPIILAGDFNTWTEEKTNTLLQVVKRLRLAEVTFTDDTRTRFMGRAIDWVFVRELNVQNSKVVMDMDSSDHRAIELALSLN